MTMMRADMDLLRTCSTVTRTHDDSSPGLFVMITTSRSIGDRLPDVLRNPIHHPGRAELLLDPQKVVLHFAITRGVGQERPGLVKYPLRAGFLLNELRHHGLPEDEVG